MDLKGLTSKQVEESRQKNGTNALTQIPPDPLWKKILEGFKDPMIMILLVAFVVQVIMFILDDEKMITARNIIKDIIGDINAPNTGIMFAMPVTYVEGIGE